MADAYSGKIMNPIAQHHLPSPESALDSMNALLKMAENRKPDPRRIAERNHIFQPCTIQPLNDDLMECGDAIPGVTRDASVSGIGFITSEAVDSPFIRVELHDLTDGDPLILKVCHQSLKGSFYAIGGELAVDWSAS